MKYSHNKLDSAQRIQSAIEYIRAHLQEPLSASQVAKIACYSEYHFQRVFKEIVGESFGEYLTRKRLEYAAIKLAYTTNPNITQIALRYGYSSLSNFSKAFEKFFGIRPSDIRSYLINPSFKVGKLQQKHFKEINSSEIFTDNPPVCEKSLDERYQRINQRVLIKDIAEIQLVFMTSINGYDLDTIHQLWESMSEKITGIGADWEDVNRFAICHDHPGLFPSHLCRYDAAVEKYPNMESIPLLKTIIPAGRYAILPCQGPPEKVLGQYIEFSTVWLPRSGYEPDDFPTIDHLLNCQKGPYIQELWRKISSL